MIEIWAEPIGTFGWAVDFDNAWLNKCGDSVTLDEAWTAVRVVIDETKGETT